MNSKALLQKLILDILASDNIESKRTISNQIVEVFKESKLVMNTPVATRLNTSLELKETIDNYITHDNTASRNDLKSMHTFVSNLLCDEVKVAV